MDYDDSKGVTSPLNLEGLKDTAEPVVSPFARVQG